MKALTIWQPWASLIVQGLKLYEFRRWPAPRSLVGQRIVIHAAKRPVQLSEIAELLNEPARLIGSTGLAGDDRRIAQATDLLDSVWNRKLTLPLGAGLGTAILGRPRTALDLFSATMDADEIDPAMWGWPMSEPIADAEPTPAAGAQGFWDWSSPAPSSEKGRTGHRCHAEGCENEVEPRMLMCLRHWRMVPRDLQKDVWREYRAGQENDKRPSEAYLAAARAAIAAVAQKEGARLL